MRLLLNPRDDEADGTTYGRNYGEQTDEQTGLPGILALSGQIKENAADREQRGIVRKTEWKSAEAHAFCPENQDTC